MFIIVVCVALAESNKRRNSGDSAAAKAFIVKDQLRQDSLSPEKLDGLPSTRMSTSEAFAEDADVLGAPAGRAAAAASSAATRASEAAARDSEPCNMKTVC
jgi:hypothetical protein